VLLRRARFGLRICCVSFLASLAVLILPIDERFREKAKKISLF
jgi:hypothetical protein